MCIIFGCMLVLSCGNKFSEQELKDLETKAEKGDVEAAVTLKNYYGHKELLLSVVEYKELKAKAEQGDVDALKKITDYEAHLKAYNRAIILAADDGDLESAFELANDYYFDLQDSVNVIENKKNFRKYMEIVIANAEGYKENKNQPDELTSEIKDMTDRYKQYYQNQSDEWWNSDSIKTKKQLSEGY